MKTISQVNLEIEQQIEIFDKEKDKKRQKKIYDKVLFLRFCVRYLETHPNENFLIKTKEDIEKRISKLNENYVYWSANVCDKNVEVKNRKSMFFRNTEINELNKRVKMLKYILES